MIEDNLVRNYERDPYGRHPDYRDYYYYLELKNEITRFRNFPLVLKRRELKARVSETGKSDDPIPDHIVDFAASVFVPSHDRPSMKDAMDKLFQ